MKQLVLFCRETESTKLNFYRLQGQGYLIGFLEDVHVFCPNMQPGDIVVTDLQRAMPDCLRCAAVPGMRKCKLILFADGPVPASLQPDITLPNNAPEEALYKALRQLAQAPGSRADEVC